jgi:hypothetical protein
MAAHWASCCFVDSSLALGGLANIIAIAADALLKEKLIAASAHQDPRPGQIVHGFPVHAQPPRQHRRCRDQVTIQVRGRGASRFPRAAHLRQITDAPVNINSEPQSTALLAVNSTQVCRF